MATTVTIDDILRPSYVLGMISRNRLQYLTVSEELGLAPANVVSSDESGGSDASLLTANAVELRARAGTYDIYDKPTSGVPAVGPGAPASREALHPIGEVAYKVVRFHPSIHLSYDKMNIQRAPGQSAAVLDTNGVSYATMQARMMGLKTLNSLEIMTLGMLQNSLYLIPSGAPESYNLSFSSSGSVGRINFQVPSGNLSTLDMLGAGAIIDAVWATDTTKILTHLNKINAAFVQLCGRPLTKVMINSIWWNYVINNTEVRTAAGTARSPFLSFDYLPGSAPDGMKKAVRKAVLHCLPGVEWIINDETLTVNGSVVKKIPDNRAFFGTDPDGVFQLGYYKEPIVEKIGTPPVLKSGFSTWYQEVTNPSGVEIFYLMNLLPMLNVPNAVAWGTI